MTSYIDYIESLKKAVITKCSYRTTSPDEVIDSFERFLKTGGFHRFIDSHHKIGKENENYIPTCLNDTFVGDVQRCRLPGSQESTIAFWNVYRDVFFEIEGYLTNLIIN